MILLRESFIYFCWKKICYYYIYYLDSKSTADILFIERFVIRDFYRINLQSMLWREGPVERRSVPGGYFSELYIQVKGMLEDRVTRG